MRSWPAVVFVVALLALALLVRAGTREFVVSHLVGRRSSRPGVGAARARAVVWLGGTSLVAALLVAVGYACRASSAPWAGARFVIAALVIALYVPAATLGAPRMTRWQKTFEQRLALAGAGSDEARAVAGVAGPVSVIGVLIGVAALPLVF